MMVHPPLTILIVDDSASVRQALKAIVELDAGFRVILAGDPYEAVEIMRRTIPSAILLDVNMPRMDGLTFLRKLMRQHPLPVLIITDEPEKGVEGLQVGALEVIPKPFWGEPSEMDAWSERLRESLRLAIEAWPSGGATPELARASAGSRYSADVILPAPSGSSRGLPADLPSIIAIGASTGGVQAIARLLRDFPADSPGIVIAQHMPSQFTGEFAHRLDRDLKIAMTVAEARPGESIRPGRVLILPGDAHGVVRRLGSNYRIDRVEGPQVNRFRPSVDVLFRSVAIASGDRGVGIILTGMLDDGAQGLLEMREAGAWTIAQDKATSIVFGMNHVAIKRGAACKVLPLDRIAGSALTRGA